MFQSICNYLSEPARLFLLLCALPVLGGGAAWLLRGKRSAALQTAAVLVFAGANFLLALSLYLGGGAQGSLSFLGEDFELKMIVSGLPALTLLFASFVFVGVSLGAAAWFYKKEQGGLFLLYLFISLGMVNGLIVSDNLGVLLFFWEGLLGTLFGLLLLRGKEEPGSALKALALSGTADLVLMFGIVITVHVAGTANISEMGRLPVEGLGGVGCALMLLGAMGKLGAAPFHSWIPDAAKDAPSPVLAAFPGFIQKIAGAYLATRVITDVYAVRSDSGMSLFVMIAGAATLILGACMALTQKDLKRVLAYHTVSVSGMALMSLGSGYSAGVAGSLFLMMSHVLTQSGLFAAAGAIEDRADSTDLRVVGGLGKSMPATAACFIALTLCAAGLPGLSGFPANALALRAAMEGGIAFFIAALAGIFITAIALFRAARAAFFGALRLPQWHRSVPEGKAGLLIPAAAFALVCLFFGVFSAFPIKSLIQPALGVYEELSGYPDSVLIIAAPLAMLALALADHLIGAKRDGALGAADHIVRLPVLRQCYALAEKGRLDPYNWMMGALSGFSFVCQRIEDGVSWVYDKGIPGLTTGISSALRRFWNGSISRYLIMALVGVACILLIFLAVML